MKVKHITFPDEVINQANKLRTKKSFSSFSALIHYCVMEAYDKNFPAYMEDRVSRTPESATDRARQKIQIKKTLAEEPYRILCEQLQGEVSEVNGQLICTYPYFFQNEKQILQAPLMNVTQGMVTSQYFPDKETVDKWRAKGKLKYTD